MLLRREEVEPEQKGRDTVELGAEMCLRGRASDRLVFPSSLLGSRKNNNIGINSLMLVNTDFQ